VLNPHTLGTLIGGLAVDLGKRRSVHGHFWKLSFFICARSEDLSSLGQAALPRAI
jgi:hypothetical protein